MSTDMNVNLATADSPEAKPNETEIAIMKARQNIDRLKDAKKNMGGSFLKIAADETKILRFTGEIDAVQRSFTRKKEDGTDDTSTKTMFAYKVLDITTPESSDEGIKTWEVSKTWSDSIDNLLTEGWLTIKVKRTGAGTNTNYLFSPVPNRT